MSDPMLVYGHRGAAGHAPENTLRGLRRALELNVDGVEFDVRSTRDGQPVLVHDATLDRTTRASGRIAELSLAELRERLRGEPDRLPSLETAIREIGSAASINVELKEIDAVEPTLAVLNAAADGGVIDARQVLVSSFDHEAVAQVCARTDRFPLGLLASGIPGDNYWQLAAELGVAFANIDLDSVDGRFVEMAHERALRVMVYTVNVPAAADRMRRIRVDGIFSDFPDRVQT